MRIKRVYLRHNIFMKKNQKNLKRNIFKSVLFSGSVIICAAFFFIFCNCSYNRFESKNFYAENGNFGQGFNRNFSVEEGAVAKTAVLNGYENEKSFSRSLKVITERSVYEYRYPQLFYGESGFVLLGFYDEVNRIYCDNYVAPVNAEVFFAPDAKNVFTYKSEKEGRYISEGRITAEIEYCLASGKSSVFIGSQSIKPEITRAELEKTACVRSRFATSYASSSAERKSNIAIAAKAVSGCVLKRGESFSFNERVGERTEARGYKKAKIISNGDFTEGVGGGVCQVSTTIYNAALKAGLTIEECHRHSLPVSYVSPSFDAMVNSGTSDLRFKNDTEADVYIACYADGEKLSVVIYGLKNEYEYRLISRVTGTIPAETVEVISKDLPFGVKQETVKPHDGLKSEGFLCVYKNGVEVFSEKIRSDVYSPRKGIVKVGVGACENLPATG